MVLEVVTSVSRVSGEASVDLGVHDIYLLHLLGHGSFNLGHELSESGKIGSKLIEIHLLHLLLEVIADELADLKLFKLLLPDFDRFQG